MQRKVFFSDLLPEKCPVLYQSITDVLKSNEVSFGLLQNTKDIWCRDYMPVQVEGKRFIYYKYNPDYLQTPYYRRTITDVKRVPMPQSEAVNLDLVIDGGNVVRCGNKVVMTEKVFAENKDKSRSEVIRLLEEAFRCEMVFLPWDRSEYLGHSDGIIHYVGDNRVMITNYNDFSPYFYRKFRKILDPVFDVIPMRYKIRKVHRHSWAYINFLNIGELVLVPQLGIPEDEQALQQISAAMPQCKVVGIPSIEAVRKGGALNCISWDISMQ